MGWLSAFFVTQCIEAPIYAYALKTRSRRWLIALGCSAFTHPIVYWAFPLIPVSYVQQVSYAEAFAVLAESVWLSAFGLRRSVWWALLANGASLTIGLALRYSIGWP